MNIVRFLALGILAVGSLNAAAGPAEAETPRPVAIVYSLTGDASLAAQGGAGRPARLFERLPAGTSVVVGPSSRLALAFTNGLRFELGERSRVKIGPQGLTSQTGPVRALPRVPPLPRLSSIAAKDRPGPRAGAVRIRAESIEGLYPRGGAAALADGTVLRFQPLAGVRSYRVEVQDGQGRIVFRTDSESPPVEVPGGTLRSGLRYLWTVRTLNRPGAVARGEAKLVILSAEDARTREETRQILAAEGPGSLPLLAAVDRSLGLLREARQDLLAALDDNPGNPALREALSEIEAQIDNAPSPGEPEAGAVVEEVAPGVAAGKAGIQPGDLLLSWSREGGNSGLFRSSFDLSPVEIEQAPRGAVTLHGTREHAARDWTLSPGSWGIKARPTLPVPLLELYQQGRDRIAAGDLDAGLGHWRSALEAADRQQDSLRAAWLQSRLAREFGSAARWAEADEAWEHALQRLEPPGPPAAQLLRQWGETLQRRNLWDRAEACYRRALALDSEESLEAAWDISALGTIASMRGDLAAGGDLFKKAYDLREKLAPGSIDQAGSLRNLAITSARRGDLEGAEKNFLKAQEIAERLAPDSPEYAATLSNLGNIALIRGDLSTAEERYRRALAQLEKLNQTGLDFAKTLANLGIVEMHRGDLALSEEHLRRALIIREKLAPETLDVASALNNLGILAEKRRDYAAAEEYHRRALDLREKLAPGSPDLCDSLYNLGSIEGDKGNLEKADEYLRRAQEIRDRTSPESLHAALDRVHRAIIAVERGDLALAEELQVRALGMLEKLSPESLAVSDSVESLGVIAFKRGDLKKAEELFRRVLAIRERMAPGTERVGLALGNLGQLYRQQGRLPLAAEHFCRATEAFDRQRKKLGGTTEGKSAFGGKTAEPYRDCLAALIDIGRPAEAFQTLERGRARSFLDLLAERDLRWTAELPPDLAEERKRADVEYDRAQTALERLSPERDQAEIDRLLVRLRELRAQQEGIAAKVRQSSPQTAALQDPQPGDLAAARAALDPGTLLLAWSIGRERSFLFVVQPAGTNPGLEVFPLAVGDQLLRERIEAFLNLLRRADSERAPLTRQARELYDLLLRPARRRIASASRLLVSPDGPLHLLPFAALVHDGRYLVEEKPIHTVLSATLYAELKKSRRERPAAPQTEIAAFGDPSYPPLQPGQPSAVHAEVRAAAGRGLALTPLPSSREEVHGIAALYPDARAFLGAEATEERARSIGKSARYLHFACHGLLDERFPLNSALALSIPEHPGENQANGLLQAWEIFESVRLDADLVTLSACDTALGKEMGGEGLVGLTRAFQYAGARSVLASLWSISDASTAGFMTRFYGYLRAGKPKDEALRAAQIDQIREKAGASHPFHWAAFELFGDWR